jgi:hypothetical protein
VHHLLDGVGVEPAAGFERPEDVATRARDLPTSYGRVSAASICAIQRAQFDERVEVLAAEAANVVAEGIEQVAGA